MLDLMQGPLCLRWKGDHLTTFQHCILLIPFQILVEIKPATVPAERKKLFATRAVEGLFATRAVERGSNPYVPPVTIDDRHVGLVIDPRSAPSVDEHLVLFFSGSVIQHA